MSTTELLTRSEARAYIKVGSDRSFYRFCRAHGLRSCGNGNYATAHIDNAIRRMIRGAKSK